MWVKMVACLVSFRSFDHPFVSFQLARGSEKNWAESEVTGLHVGLPLCQAQAPAPKEEPLLRDRTALHCAQKFSLVGYEVLTLVILKSILSYGT
jgi:hypothetical protein